MIKNMNNVKVIDERIGELLEQHAALSGSSDGRSEQILRDIETLTDIRKTLKTTNEGKILGISKDTLITSGVSIFTAMLVLKYEEENIITSKAWQMVGKLIR